MKNYTVNKKYTHFAVLKSTGLIINGWEYKNYDNEELNADKKYYFYQDIIDMQIDHKICKILTAKRLISSGINPYSWESWNKDKSIFTL